MKLSFLILAIMYFTATGLSCENNTEVKDKVPFLKNTMIEFVSKEEAKKLLGKSDEFTKSQSVFDYASKTQNPESDSESDYLEFAANQALEWTESEKKETTKVINEAKSKIEKLNLQLNLPSTIQLIKTTSLEEGGAAGYTRGSFIVVQGAPDLHLFLHELFHVFSRANPSVKDELYKTIGFKKSNKIKYPEAILPFKITNPDAPIFEHFITIDTEDGQQDAIIITKASRPYEGGSFFQYLELNLLIVEGDSDNKTPKIIDEEPVLIKFSEAKNLFEQIGNNTDYIIHPEEIMAEHFTYLVMEKEVKSANFIEAMKSILVQ